jgi:trehalose 6-phosphate synthase/phosphatase
LLLLLDYDGTLVPCEHPELAAPIPRKKLLSALAERPDTRSRAERRTRETLQRWLGALPSGFYAEHGSGLDASTMREPLNEKPLE